MPSLTSPSGEPERLATVILTRTLSGPGTQRGTGVHTNGAPGPNHPRVPRRMANTKTIVGLNCSTQTVARHCKGWSAVLAIPGLTSLPGASWLSTPYHNEAA